MTHERETAHGHDSQPARSTRSDDAVAPGQRTRSEALVGPNPPTPSGIVQRKQRDANGVAADAESAVATAATTSGQSLPTELTRKFESSLGADLSSVRVHTDSASADAANAVGAKAYTIGHDIHFAAGHYDPSSTQGEHLLAHEVAHTVQQAGGIGRRAQFKLEVSSPADAHEIEADGAADAMVRGAPARISDAGGVARKVQRKSAPKEDEKPEGGADDVVEALGHVLSRLNDDVQSKKALNAWYAAQPKVFQTMWDNPGQGAVVRFVFHKPSEETTSKEESYGSKITSGMEFVSLSYDLAASATGSVDAGPQAGWETDVVVLRLVPAHPVDQATSKDVKQHVKVSSAAEFYQQAKAPEPDLLTNMSATPIDRDHEAVRILDALLAASKAPYAEGVGYMVFVNGKGIFVEPGLHDQLTVAHGLKLQKRAAALANALESRIADAQKQFDDKSKASSMFDSHAIDLNPSALDLPRQHLADARAAAAALAIDRAFDRLEAGSKLVDLAQGQLYHYDTGQVPPAVESLKSEDD